MYRYSRYLSSFEGIPELTWSRTFTSSQIQSSLDRLDVAENSKQIEYQYLGIYNDFGSLGGVYQV